MDVHAGREKTRTLLLLDPYPRNNPYRMTASERRSIWFPKLSLPVIAAYTPPNWDVQLVDEAVQEIDLDQPCDLVGISVMTCYAPRAYELATEFRKRGKTVVLGGVHPTYCPGGSPAILRHHCVRGSRRPVAASHGGLTRPDR